MNRRVLIFDEDRDFAEAIGARMHAEGWTANVVSNRLDAASWLTWNNLDLICVDVDIEAGRGIAFCEFVTWNPDTAHIPIVVFTSASSPEAIRRCCDFDPTFIHKSSNCWDNLRCWIGQSWPALHSAKTV